MDEVPVKVVDRRWWARGDDGEGAAAHPSSLKPTYVEELEQKVAEKDKQVQEYLSKYRQAAQEFEDARARMRKELARDAERNRREVLVGLLDVLDNLDRAVDSARSAGTSQEDPLLLGVEMVRRQFLAKLDGFGVTRIETANASFDPLLHEAVSVVPTDNPADEGRIVGIVRSGYRIRDEVLRPALVAVAKSRQTVD
ncbi:MAG TPA: nucleotide exchange factor GrpE [Vicinamibacterales bacterium]|jgi:molecular chaperone GrpE